MKKVFFVLFLLIPLSLFSFELDTSCILGIENRWNFDKFSSAPSPLKFEIGLGMDCSFSHFFRISPSFVFSNDYYGWNNTLNMALPAEVERRTALVFSSMVSLPFDLCVPLKNGALVYGLGIGGYFRYGILADAVDSAYEEDVKEINKYFYENLNWLYPFTSLGITINLSAEHKIGFFMSYYYPLKNMVKPNLVHNFQDSVLSLYSKVYF